MAEFRKDLNFRLFPVVLRETGFQFVMGTVFFIAILLMFQAIRLSDFIFIHQLSLKVIGMLFGSMALSFVPVAVPISFLFAVVFAFSRMASEGEWLGFQSCGVKPIQLYYPVLFLSIFVTVFCLVGSLDFVPRANRAFELLITKIRSEKVMGLIRPGVFMDYFQGISLYADGVSKSKDKLQKVFLYDGRNEDWPLAVTARVGSIIQETNGSGTTLRLRDGSIYVDRPTQGDTVQRVQFEVYDINMISQAPKQFWRDSSSPSLTYKQLFEKMKVTERGALLTELKVEFHRRITLSLACLVFGFLGFVVGGRSQRGMRGTSILVCLLVSLFYWICWLLAQLTAGANIIRPEFALWFPNLALLVFAVLLYRREIPAR